MNAKLTILSAIALILLLIASFSLFHGLKNFPNYGTGMGGALQTTHSEDSQLFLPNEPYAKLSYMLMEKDRFDEALDAAKGISNANAKIETLAFCAGAISKEGEEFRALEQKEIEFLGQACQVIQQSTTILADETDLCFECSSTWKNGFKWASYANTCVVESGKANDNQTLENKGLEFQKAIGAEYEKTIAALSLRAEQDVKDREREWQTQLAEKSREKYCLAIGIGAVVVFYKVISVILTNFVSPASIGVGNSFANAVGVSTSPESNSSPSGDVDAEMPASSEFHDVPIG